MTAVTSVGKQEAELLLITYLANSHHSTAEVANSSCCQCLCGALATHVAAVLGAVSALQRG